MSNANLFPYPGPRPYRTEEEDQFRGRGYEIEEMSSLIVSHPVVVLYAQSGAGKSSLVNAGIVPRLKSKKVNLLPVVRVGMPLPVDIAVNEQSNVYVISALSGLFPFSEEGLDRQELLDWMKTACLSDALKKWFELAGRDPNDSRLHFLAFDQFEELFSTHADRWMDRQVFMEQVAAALAADKLLRVLFVIREDYLASFVDFADYLPERARTRYHLERLREAEALACVTEPLKDTSWAFEKGVAEKLVQDLLSITVETSSGQTITISGEFVEPVQLQVVCSSLLQRLPAGKTRISSEDLTAFGRPDEALRLFYDAAVEAVSVLGVEQGVVRSWFESHLITPAGTRGLVYRGKDDAGGLPNLIVDALEAQHLIRPEVRSGSRWYELTHDRFIRPIQESNQAWNSRFGWLKTVLQKGGDLKGADLQSPEQIRKQERLAFVAEELTSEESRATVVGEMDELARKYERVRASMEPSGRRTVAMNEVMSQMRTLARACLSLWAEYARSDSPGKRLAAIAIMQMSSDSESCGWEKQDKLDWLKRRFELEMPFVFYHASLALRKIADANKHSNWPDILDTASQALRQVISFPQPDRNTVRVLEGILVDGEYNRGG